MKSPAAALGEALRRTEHGARKTRRPRQRRSLTEAKDKGIDFYDLGSVQKIQARPQVRLDLWTIHPKSPTAALANALEWAEQCGKAPSVTSEFFKCQRHLDRFALGMMEGMSSDDEEDLFSSDEEGEHNVENILLCSFAQRACSPLLQRFLHEEELCEVALTCLFALDVLFLCQD